MVTDSFLIIRQATWNFKLLEQVAKFWLKFDKFQFSFFLYKMKQYLHCDKKNSSEEHFHGHHKSDFSLPFKPYDLMCERKMTDISG